MYVYCACAEEQTNFCVILGSKAIDCLLDSKWASGKGGTEILFTDRESVQDYLAMYAKGLFKSLMYKYSSALAYYYMYLQSKMLV